MKLTLWLYAISTGVGRAREIARLVRGDDAYRWIVGGLEICHYTLSAFRVDHGAVLDELMTDILAALLHKGVLSLDLVARDGAAEDAQAVGQARARIDDGCRGARDENGRRWLPSGLQCPDGDRGVPARRTVHDRRRPVTNVGSDMGSITPMLDEIQRRTGQLPATLLADANYAVHDCIRTATAAGVEVLVAVPERTQRGGAQADDDPAIVAWRERMETDEAKQLYRARAGLCELMNAHLRTHHGVDQFFVRGLAKVTCVVTLAAIASNLLQHASAFLA